MVKIEQNSKYLNAGNVEDGDVITFQDEGSMRETKYGNKLNIQVDHKEKSKIVTVNNKSQQMLSEAYGGDTVNWVGKTAKIKIREMYIGGEDKKVMFLEPFKRENEEW